jgi:phosphoglycolate phosphatase
MGSDDPADVADAIRHYRERYIDIGKFENELIDGIPELLDELVDEGAALFVATSKPAAYAREIVEHFDLMRRFRSLYGSGLDGTNAAKADLLKHLLTAENIAPADAIMIGDRRHDIEGAQSNGVRSVGVLWGYGDRAELEAAGADWIVERPKEIATLLSAATGHGISASQ